MWKNILEQGRPKATIWSMRNACWIPKATNTYPDYVILIAFPLQQWLQERTSVYIVCLVTSLRFTHKSQMKSQGCVCEHFVYRNLLRLSWYRRNMSPNFYLLILFTKICCVYWLIKLLYHSKTQRYGYYENDIAHSLQHCHNSKYLIFYEKLLKDFKCYNFLWVQRRHNCSPAATFTNCVMTLYMLKFGAEILHLNFSTPCR